MTFIYDDHPIVACPGFKLIRRSHGLQNLNINNPASRVLDRTEQTNHIAPLDAGAFQLAVAAAGYMNRVSV